MGEPVRPVLSHWRAVGMPATGVSPNECFLLFCAGTGSTEPDGRCHHEYYNRGGFSSHFWRGVGPPCCPGLPCTLPASFPCTSAVAWGRQLLRAVLPLQLVLNETRCLETCCWRYEEIKWHYAGVTSAAYVLSRLRPALFLPKPAA